MTDNQEQNVDSLLAHRLRSLRQQQGFKLSDTALKAGISASHLSRLESGERQPSVGSAVLLAKALGVTLSSLLLENQEHDEVVATEGSRETHTTPEGTYVRLSNTSGNTHLDVVKMQLRASTSKPEHKTHFGEEWVYVLQGRVELQLGTTSYVLDEGDAAHYLADTPHRFIALDDHAEVIISISSGLQSFH